ncbi:hypothetical protein K443DRAFT_126392 [Laccaria amethystina LaAM-08-1]|uniref:Uncharacterized protein n=1 Tax=Laccaria amethystina LaAM-08-1 TaxID=1095629 RepID=A0A0C9X2S6_9AGAR|nr:hypothetical protein K443DRAFT_126392 [Laccaria amethystina LaAM-08-1]
MKNDTKSITAEPWPEAPDSSVSDPVLLGEVDIDEMDPSAKAAYNRRKIHMDWIDHKANIVKFIPSCGAINTEADRAKHVGGGFSKKNKNEDQIRERELQHK